jgi:A/G-specific adenine glycosylase
MKNDFTSLLMKWDLRSNTRKMPWKGEKDPYKIWLSEIILQQTRVEQGWAYYEAFLKQYPTIHDLAKAKDSQVMKLWEGLGYYNRCKNLLITARAIVNNYKAIFPDDYETIVSLKGIGPYTAAAISSFAFNLPYAVVDGNVYRVLSRFFGIDTPIDSKEGIRQFNLLADSLLHKKQPGAYNQAIMDFGATICKPSAPLCITCPMQHQCKALESNQVNLLPVKLKVLNKKNRHFVFYVFEYESKYWIQQRTSKDIWNGLYQFYLLEQDAAIKAKANAMLLYLNEQLGIGDATIDKNSLEMYVGYEQKLTHQNIHASFVKIRLKSLPKMLEKHNWVSLNSLKKRPFPKIINDFLAKDFKK